MTAPTDRTSTTPEIASQYHPGHGGPPAKVGLTARQRIMIAGLGALVPIVLNLAVVDMETALARTTTLTFIGWGIRVFGLFAIGALVGWMHQTEHDRVKIFQLGIAAPALITGFINGTNVEKHGRETSSAPAVTATHGTLESRSFFVNTAWAQSREPVYSFASGPRESATQQLVRGFTGRVSGGNWFAVAEPSFTSERDARAFAARITSRVGLDARVYAPAAGPTRGYSVVVAGWVSDAEAAEKVKMLKARGVSAFSWSPALPKTPQPAEFWVFVGRRNVGPDARITGSSFRLPADQRLSTITAATELYGRSALPRPILGEWQMGSPLLVVPRGGEMRVVQVDSVPAAVPTGKAYWIWARVTPVEGIASK